MNPKNLTLKFAFVALLIAACIWVVTTSGLKLGIDLRGGHSLTYAVLSDDTTGAEVQQVIDTLKRRVDPLGLLTLEWRPVSGANRFEVRMPAAKPESLAARDAFLAKMDKLQSGNTSRRAMLNVAELTGDARAQAIDQLAADAQQRQRLTELGRAADELRAAREAAAKAPEDAAARQAEFAAAVAFDKALAAVEQTNVNVGRLQNVLNTYLSKDEVKNLRKTNRDEAARRQKEYGERLAELLEQHPARADEIKGVVGAYEYWAENRQRLDDPSDLQRLIAKAGVLEFRIVPMQPQAPNAKPAIEASEMNSYLQSLAESGPEALQKRNDRYVWKAIRGNGREYAGFVTGEYGSKRYLLVYNQPDWMMTRGSGGGWKLDNAFKDQDEVGRPAVGFVMDARGAQLMAALTSAHVGEHMAILLDDEVYSAPVIKSMISDRGQISGGDFTDESVQDLVQVLKAGALPAKLNTTPVAISSFGPSLGEENLRMGTRAGIWAFAAVALFMLVYYVLGGAIANAALCFNVLLVIGSMSVLGAVMTMPGIAGIILGIGMAVDANVLIFERLREEQAKGLHIRMALKNAYERAFSAIFDSNVTTLITCGILGWVGTEEVKGFAITLGLAVLFNLFTAVVVTRWVFQGLLQLNLLKRPVRMLKLIGVPKIDWMGKRYYFWAFSLATLVVGIAALAWQGGDIWGIEFSAGTQATISFVDDASIDGKAPNDSIVRETFVDKAGALGFARLRDTARVEKVIDRDRVGTVLKTYDSDKDGAVSLSEWKTGGRDEAYFKAYDTNGDGKLTGEEIVRLPVKSYQIATTETDLAKIRQTASEAFGASLETRDKIAFTLVDDAIVPELGVRIAPGGATRIDAQMIQQASSHRSDLQEYQGGVLLVVRDLQPAVTRTELASRLREIRLQPDYSGGQFNPSEIVGLKPAGNERFTAFAVMVKPSDPDEVSNENAWLAFARNEHDALTTALSRSESMIAVNFDAQIAGAVRQSAIVAIVLSWAAIIAYLWVRFGSVQWGLAAVICLIHDSVLITGLVAVSGWLSHTYIGQALGVESFKIDLAMVAALLTLIGYSVNDTIVVFDRIRENRGRLSTVTASMINLSVNQTLGRTLLTSSGVLLVVLIMYVWGGAGIHAFNYALFLGVVFGTYSSIAVAAPLLLGFKEAIIRRVVTTEQTPQAQPPHMPTGK
jgi:SecD/SecF fusion protein